MNRKIEILKSGSWIATIVKLIIFRIIILVIDRHDVMVYTRVRDQFHRVIILIDIVLIVVIPLGYQLSITVIDIDDWMDYQYG